jgi:CRISPR-associated protein Cas1
LDGLLLWLNVSLPILTSKAMQLVLDTNGLVVKKKNNSFWIISKEKRRLISPRRVDSIAVTADCLLSAAAIRLAARHQIPIYFFDGTARLQARLGGPGFGSIASIRRQQVLFAQSTAATQWIIELLLLKASHQVSCLSRMGYVKPGMQARLREVIPEIEAKAAELRPLGQQLLSACQLQLMGQEGNIAKLYWQSLAMLLPEELGFGGRSRRPARDPFNAALNYAYGMLYGLTGSAILAAGLDTHLGLLHADAYNKPTFTFDLIEPFRPWVDEMLVKESLKKKLQLAYFDEKEGAFTLNKAGKRFLIPLFNDHMAARIRFRGRLLSRKNHVYRFAGEFAQFLLKWEPPQ